MGHVLKWPSQTNTMIIQFLILVMYHYVNFRTMAYIKYIKVHFLLY